VIRRSCEPIYRLSFDRASGWSRKFSALGGAVWSELVNEYCTD